MKYNVHVTSSWPEELTIVDENNDTVCIMNEYTVGTYSLAQKICKLLNRRQALEKRNLL